MGALSRYSESFAYQHPEKLCSTWETPTKQAPIRPLAFPIAEIARNGPVSRKIPDRFCQHLIKVHYTWPTGRLSVIENSGADHRRQGPDTDHWVPRTALALPMLVGNERVTTADKLRIRRDRTRNTSTAIVPALVTL